MAKKFMVQEKSCGTIVFRKEKDGTIKYLLLHYNEGHWEFPKGHIEKNEKEEQTAHRELKEETGITECEMQDGFREEINYFFKADGKDISKHAVFFLVMVRSSEIVLSNEHIGFAWLNFEHSMKKLKFENSKKLLTKAKEFIEKNHL